MKALPRAGLLCAAMVSAPALATNGYFAEGYSSSQLALGGTGTALTQDALVVSVNPAGAAWVGDRLDVGLGLFMPVRSYTAGPVGAGAQNSILRIGEENIDSENPRYYIPGLAYESKLSDVSSWGVALYGNGGMNTEYAGNVAHFAEGYSAGSVGLTAQCHGTFGGGEPVAGSTDNAGFCGHGRDKTQIDLIQVFIAPHYARKIGESSSIGIAPLVAAQRFRADGLQAFAQFSNAPDKVSDSGVDWGFGYGGRVGFLTNLGDHITVGGSYQSRIRMSPFKHYAGLFADQGAFDVPSTWNAGLALQPVQEFLVAFDFQHINYSEIAAVGNRFDPNDFVNNCARPRLLATLGLPGGSTTPSPACLGSATGPGFGWQDMNVRKFGLQYSFGELKLRAGYSATHQPIPDTEMLFNLLAPGVVEKHYTAGLAWDRSRAWGFELAAVYAPRRPVTGKNPLSNTSATSSDLILGSASNQTAFGPDPNDQDITIDMHQYEVTMGMTYHFD